MQYIKKEDVLEALDRSVVIEIPTGEFAEQVARLTAEQMRAAFKARVLTMKGEKK